MRQRLLDSCTNWLIRDMVANAYFIKIEIDDMSTFKLGLLRIVMPISKGIRTLINL